MPTPVLTKSKAQVPFLGDKLSNVRGLDMLGLQATSEVTYGLLLPGLTNVTHRIRYYGFYCWLLDQYASQVGEVDPKRQQNFIRRADLLVALLIRLGGKSPLHIPGSAYAELMLVDKEANGYRLDEGADLPSKGNAKTYWKARMGAFGQYYAGSLRAVGLMSTSVHDEQLYVRTNHQTGWLTGQELAAAFAEQIPLEVQECFIACVENGLLRPKNAQALFDHFDLSRFAQEGVEPAAYLRMLTSSDYPSLESDMPTYHRATTLRLLLTHLQQAEQHTWESFLIDNYLKQGRGNEEPTRRGWYFYQLNEYWQMASGSVLAAVLRMLEAEPGSYAFIPAFLTDFTEQIIAQLHQLVPNLPNLPDQPTLATLLVAIEEAKLDEEDFVRECLIEQSNKEPVGQAAAAFCLLSKIYQRNYSHLPELREYAQPLGLLREGNFLGYAERLTEKLTWPLDQFVRHFTNQDVIVRHQYVAMRKMGSGQQSTLKFEVEGEWFRCLESIQVRFSGPRLNVLLEMALDLKLLDKDNTLTARGKALLV
ncbi:hypothetical protein [Hymenobacter aerophilus]|uniref:hypothetical protein n=1 Tax=Hymenobacter aerophilus TaxID=119644 RepID=UPI00037D949B|nr:hypothetical protein [Hymenobacter aerophilus]